VDDPDIPPILAQDIILYWAFFIPPQMLGEMSLFHDKPTSLLLVLLIPRSSPPIHLHPGESFWAWSQGLFMPHPRSHSLLYLTLLYFLHIVFYRIPFGNPAL
jgi:hypothetical protein